MERLSAESGVSKSQISRIENEKRGWSIDSLTKIAEAFGVTPTQLLVLSDAWFDAPIFGAVGDDGVITPAGTKPKHHKVPAAFGDVLALRVESDSLYPRYSQGEFILCQKDSMEPRNALGRECLVVLSNGRSLIRTVNPGSKARHYHLTSHSQPQISDAAILTCHPTIRF